MLINITPYTRPATDKKVIISTDLKTADIGLQSISGHFGRNFQHTASRTNEAYQQTILTHSWGDFQYLGLFAHIWVYDEKVADPVFTGWAIPKPSPSYA
jgi:hypothetical protein